MPYMNESALAYYDPKLKDWVGDQPVKTIPSSLYPWTLTEKAGAVTCWPVGGTSLLPTVDFLFSETGPASGDKGPENPSTITGVSSVKVTRCGKNLLIPKPVGTYSSNHITATTNGDGIYTLDGTATDTAYISVFGGTNDLFYVPAGTYSLSGCPAGGIAGGYQFFAGADIGASDYGDGVTKTINTATGGTGFYIRVASGRTVSNLVFKPQFELGASISPFELYEGDNYTISLGSTYYGGTLDVASGVMTVTYVGYTFTGSEDYNWQSASLTDVTRFFVSPLLSLPKNSQIAYCSHFPFLFDFAANSTHFYVGTTAGGVFFYYPDPTMTVAQWKSWLASQYVNNTPVTVCYEVAEPFTVQLSPVQISALAQIDKYTPRLNTIYTDAQAVQVGYVKSPIREEQELTQAIVSQGGNI